MQFLFQDQIITKLPIDLFLFDHVVQRSTIYLNYFSVERLIMKTSKFCKGLSVHQSMNYLHVFSRWLAGISLWLAFRLIPTAFTMHQRYDSSRDTLCFLIDFMQDFFCLQMIYEYPQFFSEYYQSLPTWLCIIAHKQIKKPQNTKQILQKYKCSVSIVRAHGFLENILSSPSYKCDTQTHHQ